MFRRPRKLFARTKLAKSTLCTRLLSIRKGRTVFLLKVSSLFWLHWYQRYRSIHKANQAYGTSILLGKRRYDRKQSGYGGQTKPVFHKKVNKYLMSAASVFGAWNISRVGHINFLNVYNESDVIIFQFVDLIGKNNKEDCVEAAMSVLQALFSTCNQGELLTVFIFTVLLLFNDAIFCYVVPYDVVITHIYNLGNCLRLAFIVLQRCKHFEIGGDKKGKGTSLF